MRDGRFNRSVERNSVPPAPARAGSVFTIWAIVLMTSSAVVAAGPTVTITGGADQSGHHYAWTITHDHASPMVYVAFPHYMANFFTPPPGWTSSITHPVGERRQAGRCIANADRPSTGLKHSQSAEFTMSIAPDGAPRGSGDVLIRFADGAETVVRAEVPIRETAGNRNVSLIGLGAIFMLFLLAQAARRKRARAARTPEHAPPS